MKRKTKSLLVLAGLFPVFWGWTPEGRGFPSAGAARIAGCPDSPNCVSSRDPPGRRWIAPLGLRGSPEEAFRCLKEILLQGPRTTLVVEEGGYLHAESRTALGFVDDVEFEFDPESRSILLRSASRTGYWDLGVNRRRLEALRAAFESKCRQGGNSRSARDRTSLPGNGR
ncbi:MAG TPA: DUF1499 domain-containing protein [Syntrophobacteraceae bacterium]|nr:DUF1499 domain-containing protein [Syntrophobacteraceae bacterium]